VIGSKSPILDKDAIQFTRNFFNALLKGNASYEEAYNQAHKNLDNTDVKAIKLTRGGGDMQEELNQNDYFISINQEEFAGQKFPFKRKQTSIWLKAIPILLTIFIGTWFVITFKKIECPKWVDYQKCNILVSNFNDLSGKNRNVNRLISESLSMNKVLEPYIEAINKKSLEEIFINSAQEVSKLFSKCKCDYYISGNLEDIENASIIQMNLLPLEQGQFSTEKHTFGILLDFGEMIQTIDPEKDSGSSIITQICLACAKNNTNSNNKQLLQIAENQTKSAFIKVSIILT